jgi:hypothetical protein
MLPWHFVLLRSTRHLTWRSRKPVATYATRTASHTRAAIIRYGFTPWSPSNPRPPCEPSFPSFSGHVRLYRAGLLDQYGAFSEPILGSGAEGGMRR